MVPVLLGGQVRRPENHAEALSHTGLPETLELSFWTTLPTGIGLGRPLADVSQHPCTLEMFAFPMSGEQVLLYSLEGLIRMCKCRCEQKFKDTKGREVGS